jgi:hypothetical protein
MWPRNSGHEASEWAGFLIHALVPRALLAPGIDTCVFADKHLFQLRLHGRGTLDMRIVAGIK